MRDKSEVFEAMWKRRKQAWDEILRAERRYADEAIFRLLKDREGDHEDDQTG